MRKPGECRINIYNYSKKIEIIDTQNDCAQITSTYFNTSLNKQPMWYNLFYYSPSYFFFNLLIIKIISPYYIREEYFDGILNLR